jgi:hypothetical protein
MIWYSRGFIKDFGEALFINGVLLIGFGRQNLLDLILFCILEFAFFTCAIMCICCGVFRNLLC